MQRGAGQAGSGPQATPFDFRRLDRIPKSQLKAIRLLHDNFARNLGSSLAAYLRTYVTLTLVSVEQPSYAELLEGVSSPTCMVCLGLRPYDGNAVMDLSPALAFAVLEILMGGKGKPAAKINREITDIEQNLLDGFLRIMLQDLKEAWQSVAAIDFTVEAVETEPQFVQILDPGEAFVAVGMETRIGDTTGMLNLAFPALMIKMMRSRFDHQGSLRKIGAGDVNEARMLRLIEKAEFDLDVRLEGPSLRLEDLMNVEEGDVLRFDFPVSRLMNGLVNGRLKWNGRVVQAGEKLAFLVDDGRAAG